MNRPEVDRQLLLALLAFQLNFLDRAKLLSVFDAWMQADAARTLGSICVEAGFLTSDDLKSLENIVAKFVERFDGDVAKSLAHISSLDSSVRDELRTRAEPEMQASLAIVGQAVDPYATVAQSVGEQTSQGTRFRILRPHARGGLGEVFVAEDGELHREVALKQIQSRHADDASSRSRFLLEAEITGGLEHPSIVPVYGLGTYADGRPFYAMRFIRGDSLQEAIARFHDPARKLSAGERSIEFRKLLQRFIDVCMAIDYAHSRGVLHRDLKPGNIMLGKYGETLVVDWGLAKALGTKRSEPGASATGAKDGEAPLKPSSGSGSTPTRHGSTLGTVGYMSPEQSAGKIDELTPATDVYGLGATLYHLLTGNPSVTGTDYGVLLDRIQRGDFPSPRQVKPETPGHLEAICLKAMALKPADRYATARALADDVEQWLADEPVTAAQEGLLHRVRRWGRKHRALVTSASLASIVVAIVAVLAAASINASRHAEQSARRLADAQRAKADAHGFLVVDMFFALVVKGKRSADDVRGLDDLKPEIAKVAESGVALLRQVTSGGDALPESTSIDMPLKIGSMLLYLHKDAEAEQAFELAVTQYEKRLQIDPESAPAMQSLALALNNLGDLAASDEEFGAAQRLYERSIAQYEKVMKKRPTDSDVIGEIAESRLKLGTALHNQKHYSAAESQYELARRQSEDFVRKRPGVAAAVRLSTSAIASLQAVRQQGNPVVVQNPDRQLQSWSTAIAPTLLGD